MVLCSVLLKNKIPVLDFSHLPSLITSPVFHPAVPQLIQVRTDFSHYVITLIPYSWGSRVHTLHKDRNQEGSWASLSHSCCHSHLSTCDQIHPRPCPGAQSMFLLWNPHPPVACFTATRLGDIFHSPLSHYLSALGAPTAIQMPPRPWLCGAGMQDFSHTSVGPQSLLG